MTDYSHLFQIPRVVVSSLDRGYRVEDENWLGTVRRLEPPLLSEAELQALAHILDPAVERRGGKSVRSLSEPLIEKLRQAERPDIPARFLEGLIERLVSGKRYTRRDSDREYGKRWRKFERDRLFVYFYDYIYDHLEGDTVTIDHEVFDAIPVSKQGNNRSQKALATLHDFLCERTIFDPPSQGTLLRIVSEAPDRKKHSKS